MITLKNLLDEVEKAGNDLASQFEIYKSLPVDDEFPMKVEACRQSLNQLNVILQIKLQSALTMSREVGKTFRKK